MDERKPPRVAMTTLGCKVNQFESAAFTAGFRDKGAVLVAFSQPADVYVINTCAVTAKAAMQSRQMIRRALKANPDARIVVTGCYSQVASQEVFDLIDHPVCIVGNGCKDRLVDIALASEHCDLEMFMADIGRQKEICRLPVSDFADRTRAFLKIQDGCDRFCSYCIVPYARGPSRSLPPDEVESQAAALIGRGYREIVLTGIHIGMYGLDLAPPHSLDGLLDRLTVAAAPVRYRISSLESAEITERLLDLIAARPAVMPHLHIPLQSGDDEILARMNRPYTAARYRQTVERCLARLPDAAIGVDVLVGFPGETSEQFGNTCALLEELPVTYLHVFPYSRRPGTVAAEMKGQVAKGEKDARVARLRELDGAKRAAFYRRHLGSVRPVLAENRNNSLRLMRGFTDNYIPVHFDAPAETGNRIVMVRLDRVEGTTVFGTRVETE
ncbi:MAG: tRNA (N(6)-L-threonylcarbamoyladenosine(37)-C(2))-methylthiotransferase MtaB [Thermodesulfobacteriota bacterium]